MSEASGGHETGTAESTTGGTVTNQLAILVPTFDPAKDDLQVYQQKVALLLEAWPSNKYTELATRLILNCVGSAFQKLQLHQSELMVNDPENRILITINKLHLINMELNIQLFCIDFIE